MIAKARALTAPACALLALGCDGVDLNHMGNYHRCPTAYNAEWYYTDMRIEHDNTTRCPITVYSAGQDMIASTGATDPDEPDAQEGSLAELSIYASSGERTGYGSDRWLDFLGEREVFATTVYDAAMGTLRGRSPDDTAILRTRLVNGAVADAEITLQVLFGPRNEEIRGAVQVPPGQYCRWSAVSTLNGVVRDDMAYYAWKLDGEVINPVLEVHTEGPHWLEYTAMDDHGYMTSAGMQIEVVNGIPAPPECQV